MENKTVWVYIFIIIICMWQCVSPQIITTGSIRCKGDGARNIEKEFDFLFEVVKQQSIQIQEISEKLQLQEDILRNISETTSSVTVPTTEESEEKRNANETNSGQFGQEFILAFPYLREVHDITLLLVSLSDATVAIHSFAEGINRTVSLSNSRGTSISLSNSLATSGSYLGNNTVSLHSNTNIAVFVLMTGVSGTGDGYLAIPRGRLRNKYFFSMNNKAVLSFVAFYDNTIISISNTTGETFSFLSVGSSISNTITLKKEEVVQLRLGGFMIGTVEGTKPFMVLHGSYSEFSFSTYGTSYIDSIPDSEGRLFIIPYLSSVSGSMTICNAHESTVAISDVTVQRFRHNYRTILNYDKATYMYLDLNTTCHYIGHGFSVTIPSVQSYTTYCRFLTPSHHSYTHHAVVMIQSDFKDGVIFKNITNDQLVAPYKVEKTTADGTIYDVLYYNIDVGQYEVYHEMNDVQFGVITYGFGTDQQIAYAYPACFK